MICIEDFEKSPLKETSFDSSNKEYMTQSAIEVINFDKLKEKFVQEIKSNSERKFCSNDALFFCNDDEIYMIEFKNGKIDDKVIYNLYWKNYDSVLIYMHYNLKDIKSIKDNLNYILVYNEDKNPNTEGTDEKISHSKSRNMIGQNFAKNAKEEFAQFSLGHFKNYTFKEVYTLTTKQFEERFLSQWE